MRSFLLILAVQVLFAIPVFAAPTVTVKSPTAGSSGVSPLVALSATFSEAMSPASITGNSFTLEKRVGVVAIAAGYNHTLVLKGDGTVAMWGKNSWDKVLPAGLNNVVSVAAGDYHSLALKNDGTVVGAGSNINGAGYVPVGLSSVVAIAAGPNHSVALKNDGTVVAWGDNYFGQSTVPIGLSGVKGIAAGVYHTVAVKEDGTVVAWGYNYYGECTAPAGLTGVVAVAAGQYRTLALKSDGTVVAWGDTSEATSVPAGLTDVVSIAAGQVHSVALKSDGTVVAWGNNFDGRVNVPQGLSDVTAISTQAGHTVALKGDGTVVTWGLNDFWQTQITSRISGATNIAGASEDTLVALKGDGSLSVWGNVVGNPESFTNVTNVFDGLSRVFALKSDTTIAPVTTPNGMQYAPSNVPPDLSGVVAAASSQTQAFAVKNDGTVVAWGNSNSGVVLHPENFTGIADIAANSWAPPGAITDHAYVMMLKNDGTVVSLSNDPVIDGLTNVVDISVGPGFAVALKADGTVVAWGDNSFGQTNVPAGLSNVIAISAGFRHVLALKSDGTVVTWGTSEWGILNIPNGLSNVVDISARYADSVALKSDGSIVVWGNYSNTIFRVPTDPYYSLVAASVAYDNNTQIATLTPNAPLEAQAVYRATVFGRSADGTPMAGSHSWAFTPTDTLSQFLVTPKASMHGTVSPTTAQLIKSGATTSFALTPDTGYKIESVTGCNGTLSGTTYTTGQISQSCSVQVSFSSLVDKPLAITAPSVSNADGAYTISWSASPSTDVIYILEEATNGSFSAGLRTVYSGTGLTVNITGNSIGTTYYYRVKATKSGNPDSAWVSSASGTACVSCPPGAYLPSGAVSCIPAPAGFYVATSAQSSATACAAGTYQDQIGQTFCLQAPQGSYVALTGQSAATVCAVGTYQNQAGQLSCSPAPVGYYVPIVNQTAPSLCPARTSQNLTGQSSCYADNDDDDISDALDSDDDNDGIPDITELANGTDPFNNDTVAPVLTVSTLADGNTTATAACTISGSASDNSSLTSLTINGTAVTVLGNGSYNHLLTLAGGSNTITVVATDAAGNKTTNIRTVMLDTTAPLLTVTTPADSSKTAQLLAIITGTIDETSTVTVKVNSGISQNATVSANSYSATVSLDAGVNTITITATDLAGNTSSAVRTITYDNSAPSLAITNPNQDISTALNTMTISGTVSDTITTTTVSLSFNGQTFTPAVTNGAFSQQLTFPGEATWPIVVTATDETGNSATVTRNIMYAIPVNGSCGASHNAPLTVAPTNFLCSSGTASVLAGSGPWSWTCGGTNNGTIANCATSVIPQYTVTPTAGTGYSVTPASPQTVTNNATISFSVSPASGYGIIASGCGGTLTGTTYTTGAITADCTVSVTAVSRTASISGTAPTMNDALKTLQAVAGVTTLSEADKIRYDIAPLNSGGNPAGNGAIDLADVIMILRRSIGIGTW